MPAASVAVTVMVLFPDCRLIPVADQSAVPEAVPEPPLLLTQLTWVTPWLSEELPPRVILLFAVVYVDDWVGDVMVISGSTVS